MSEKILVIGATGNIGSYVTAILKEKGADFVAGVSKPDTKIAGVKTVLFDYTDHASMLKAMKGVHTVFLLAPFVPEMKDWLMGAIKAAKEAGVRYIVRSSAIGADADSGAALAKVHGEVDKALMESGIAFAIVRPMTFMQNFATYHRENIRKLHTIYQPQGDGRSSFVHVRDVAAVAVELILNQQKYQGKAYDVTGGEALSNADVAAIISDVSGSRVTYVDVPEDAAVKAMQDMGMPQILIDQLMSLNRITKAGYTEVIAPTVLEITGRPPITFRQFAEENAGVWKP
ncbi:MAG: SDR family oxidoreductase [Desulfomonilia bacterium]|jgi:uncharacterized protein YbjT (DUF2867 family)